MVTKSAPFQLKLPLLAVLCHGLLVCDCAPSWALETADVYLFAGQSNMWGTGTSRSQLPVELTGVQPEIQILEHPPAVPVTGWYPLENGVNNNYPGGTWACEAQLTHRLVAGHKPIYVINFSLAGSWLAVRPHERDWNPRSRGELLDGLIASELEAKSRLEAAGKQPRFKALIWMQGESDCNEPAAADSYQANLEELIAKVRGAVSAPDMAIYMGRIHSKYRRPYLQTVRAAQGRTASAGKSIFLLDTDAMPLQGDNIHFAPQGHVAIGDAIADLIAGKTKPIPCTFKPPPMFTIREFAGPGTIVGSVELEGPGMPSPTYILDDPGFEINGETGQIKVKDLSAVDSARTKQLSVQVRAINGASPSATETITIQFQTSSSKAGEVANQFAIFDPDSSSGRTLVDGKFTEIHDGSKVERKFAAPDAARRPASEAFPGTKRIGLRFEGTQMMRGPLSDNILCAGVDQDLTAALAVHIPRHTLKSRGWCLVINKSVTEAALGIGFDYATNIFFMTCANPFNGASEVASARAPIAPGTSHVVRLRKVADTCRLFVDGTLAAEVVGNVRGPILAAREGAPIGIGGTFPPNPSFTGTIGKIFLVKGIPTLQEESLMDRNLADWTKSEGTSGP